MDTYSIITFCLALRVIVESLKLTLTFIEFKYSFAIWPPNFLRWKFESKNIKHILPGFEFIELYRTSYAWRNDCFHFNMTSHNQIWYTITESFREEKKRKSRISGN